MYSLKILPGEQLFAYRRTVGVPPDCRLFVWELLLTARAAAFEGWNVGDI